MLFVSFCFVVLLLVALRDELTSRQPGRARGPLPADKGHGAWASGAGPRLRVQVCMGIVVGSGNEEWGGEGRASSVG